MVISKLAGAKLLRNSLLVIVVIIMVPTTVAIADPEALQIVTLAQWACRTQNLIAQYAYPNSVTKPLAGMPHDVFQHPKIVLKAFPDHDKFLEVSGVLSNFTVYNSSRIRVSYGGDDKTIRRVEAPDGTQNLILALGDNAVWTFLYSNIGVTTDREAREQIITTPSLSKLPKSYLPKAEVYIQGLTGDCIRER